jgi:hypothetical protein
MYVRAKKKDEGGKVVFVDPPADAEIGERVILCKGFEGDPASENQVGKKKILDKVLPDLRTDDNGLAMYVQGRSVAMRFGRLCCSRWFAECAS